jgi:thioredoxin 1
MQRKYMEINNTNFKQEVEDYNGVVLVDFFAEWCGPCKMMLPVIAKVEEKYKDKEGVKVLKVDIDQAKEVAEKYNIMGVPTFMVFKGGNNVEEVSGVQSEEALIQLVEKNL